jgi:hypothetical protein
MRLESTVWLSVAARVSIMDACASTVTVSCTLPTSTVRSTWMFSLACGVIPPRSLLRKPAYSTVRLYTPTGNKANTYDPFASVVTFRVKPVAALIIVILAA